VKRRTGEIRTSPGAEKSVSGLDPRASPRRPWCVTASAPRPALRRDLRVGRG
jgi:hypothetical protein